jgi:hypothetical protein
MITTLCVPNFCSILKTKSVYERVFYFDVGFKLQDLIYLYLQVGILISTFGMCNCNVIIQETALIYRTYRLQLYLRQWEWCVIKRSFR